MRPRFVFSGIWIGQRRVLALTLAFIVVVAISLFLVGSGLLFGKQAARTRPAGPGQAGMSIYFCIKTSPNPVCTRNGPATQTEKNRLRQRLEGMPQVQSVRYVSQAEQYQNFRREFSNYPSLVNNTPSYGIPDSLEVKLKNPRGDYRVVASVVNGAAGVDNVVNEMDNPPQVVG